MSDTGAEGDNIFDMFGTSERDAEDGKWFKLGKFAEVKVRRYSAKKSRKVREALDSQWSAITNAGGKIPDEANEQITNEHIATGILVDWRGIKGKDGKAIPFSKKAAIEMLELLPDFRNAVAGLSLKVDNFREAEKDEIEGN